MNHDTSRLIQCHVLNSHEANSEYAVTECIVQDRIPKSDLKTPRDQHIEHIEIERKHNHQRKNTKLCGSTDQIQPTSMGHNEKDSLHENKVTRNGPSVSLLR